MKKHRTAALGALVLCFAFVQLCLNCSFEHERKPWTFAAVSPRGVKIDLSE